MSVTFPDKFCIDAWYRGSRKIKVDQCHSNFTLMTNGDKFTKQGNEIYLNGELLTNMPDINPEDLARIYTYKLRKKGYKILECNSTTSITVSPKQSLNSNEYRISFENKGYLDYSEEDGAYFMQMIEVKEEYRNQKIATRLLEYFLTIVNKNYGYLDISGYLDDGKKYIEPMINQMLINYPNITI